MKENELIGIAGVFVLTFALIALYHFIGWFGRQSRAHRARSNSSNNVGEPRRESNEQPRIPGRDDSWLLWNRELEIHSFQSGGEVIRRSPKR